MSNKILLTTTPRPNSPVRKPRKLWQRYSIACETICCPPTEFAIDISLEIEKITDTQKVGKKFFFFFFPFRRVVSWAKMQLRKTRFDLTGGV